MSDQIVKDKRNKRFQKEQNNINRQCKIAKYYGVLVDNPHKYAKMHSMNCGNPNCSMCSNPRRVWKEKTIQEIKMLQNVEECV